MMFSSYKSCNEYKQSTTSSADFSSTKNMNLILNKNAEIVKSMSALFIISIIIIILVLSNFI